MINGDTGHSGILVVLDDVLGRKLQRAGVAEAEGCPILVTEGHRSPPCRLPADKQLTGLKQAHRWLVGLAKHQHFIHP